MRVRAAGCVCVCLRACVCAPVATGQGPISNNASRQSPLLRAQWWDEGGGEGELGVGAGLAHTHALRKKEFSLLLLLFFFV